MGQSTKFGSDLAEPPRVSADILPGTARVPFSLSMLGWALNEEESLGVYIDRAGAFLAALTDDYELILIDDGSTDRTWAIAVEYQRTRPWLKPYQNERNRGSGYNTKRAVSLATKDYVFWQTVDWSYDLRHLARALPKLKDVDVLQGVRTNATSVNGMIERRSDSAYKGLVSLVNYWLIRLLFRLPIGDYQNVTVYPRHLIQSILLESESSFTNPECLLKTWWRGATFLEVPVPFVKRQRGIGKGTRPGAVLTAIKDILYWWNRWLVLGRRTTRGRGSVIRAE
jgi:glycosyltransferase involved in cell wall biosynthesis